MPRKPRPGFLRSAEEMTRAWLKERNKPKPAPASPQAPQPVKRSGKKTPGFLLTAEQKIDKRARIKRLEPQAPPKPKRSRKKLTTKETPGFLKTAEEKLAEMYPELIKYHNERAALKIKAPVQFEDEEGRIGWMYPSPKSALSKVPWAREIRQFDTFKQARAWWQKVTGGADYFVIVRVPSEIQPGKFMFKIFDIRTKKERTPKEKGGKRGTLDGVTRASQILKEQSKKYYKQYSD